MILKAVFKVVVGTLPRPKNRKVEDGDGGPCTYFLTAPGLQRSISLPMGAKKREREGGKELRGRRAAVSLPPSFSTYSAIEEGVPPRQKSKLVLSAINTSLLYRPPS